MKTKQEQQNESVPEAIAPGDVPVETAPVTTVQGTDTEALREENEQLKATIRLTEAHRRITGELARAGARSPELLFASVGGDVQFDEDGAVANAAALVERLKASFPEQFGFDRPVGSINGGAGVAVAPRLTKEALAKMKPAEIAALDWADVRRVLAA